MTETINNMHNRTVPKEIALPAKPRLKINQGSDLDISVSVDYAVLTNKDIENYLQRGDYDADENVIDNEYLDNYNFLKDEVNIPETIPENAYFNEPTEEPYFSDESFQKAIEKQRSRKANRSYWEPAAFVYGAKRASNAKGKWKSNGTVKYQKPKSHFNKNNDKPEFRSKFKSKSLFQKLVSWAF